ncbi:uncharacterized protein [Dermacentor andersoni]|uniref:uncharacterized protein n=1 Tax=Dermacentor andersoni TaxID=34620 RepID=UPI002155C1AD|nr:uncharacterized protein LOC126524402 [Dermacentor andersoni]
MSRLCVFAGLVVFATHAYGGPFNRLFCPTLCNPQPERPLKSCVHSCGFLRYGKYYDGSICWYLAGSGRLFGVRGYCKQGLCLRVLTGGYEGSDAQKHCDAAQTEVGLHSEIEGKGVHVKGAQATKHFSAISTAFSPELNVKSTALTGVPHTSLAQLDHSKVTKTISTLSLSSSDASTPTHEVAQLKTVTKGEEPNVFNKTTSSSSHNETVTAQSMSPESSPAKSTSKTGTQPKSYTHSVYTNSGGPPPPSFILHSGQPTPDGAFLDKNKIDSIRSVAASASTSASSIPGMAHGNIHTDGKATSGIHTTAPTENNGQSGDSSRNLDNDSIKIHVPKTQALFPPSVPTYITIPGDSALSSSKVATTGGTPTSNTEITAASTTAEHLSQTENTNNGAASTNSMRKQTSHGNALSNFSAAHVGSIIQALRSAGNKWFNRTKPSVPDSTAPPEATTTKYSEKVTKPSETSMSVEVINAPLTSSAAASATHPPTENESTPVKITNGHYVVGNASSSAADVPTGRYSMPFALLMVLANYWLCLPNFL